MLPKKDGFGVLLELRNEKKSTPMLMLTVKGAIEDKIKELDLGTDDYPAKPFSMEELPARIRTFLRPSNKLVSPIMKITDIILNTVAREVYKGSRAIELTPKEFSILEFLLYNKNYTISRYTIAEHVWGDEFDPVTMSNSIDVHIKNLRKKLHNTEGRIINTVQGVGYMIKDDRW